MSIPARRVWTSARIDAATLCIDPVNFMIIGATTLLSSEALIRKHQENLRCDDGRQLTTYLCSNNGIVAVAYRRFHKLRRICWSLISMEFATRSQLQRV